MKAQELRKLDDAAIALKIEEHSKELFGLRMKLAIGDLENTSHIKVLKKDIARMKLIITERKKG